MCALDSNTQFLGRRAPSCHHDPSALITISISPHNLGFQLSTGRVPSSASLMARMRSDRENSLLACMSARLFVGLVFMNKVLRISDIIPSPKAAKDCYKSSLHMTESYMTLQDTTPLSPALEKSAAKASEKLQSAKAAIGTTVLGQETVVELAMTAILSGGHALLVGVPGLAKTLLVETIGTVMGLDGKRIQFTPDLMPADIIGSRARGTTCQPHFMFWPRKTQLSRKAHIRCRKRSSTASYSKSMLISQHWRQNGKFCSRQQARQRQPQKAP